MSSCRLISLICQFIATNVFINRTSCTGGRHNMPRPLQVDLWPFNLESGVRITCDVGYLCANFSLSRPLCSLLRSDVATDRRQTDVRRASSLNAAAMGAGHNNVWQRMDANLRDILYTIFCKITSPLNVSLIMTSCLLASLSFCYWPQGCGDDLRLPAFVVVGYA